MTLGNWWALLLEIAPLERMVTLPSWTTCPTCLVTDKGSYPGLWGEMGGEEDSLAEVKAAFLMKGDHDSKPRSSRLGVVRAL